MEDERIIRLYWDRDERAISVTAEKYGGYCAAIANNILGNHEDAEECVNDTYQRAWNAMPPHWPAILSAFLGKITRNLSLNRKKKRGAEKRGNGEIPLVWEELEEVVSGVERAEQALDREELAAAINAFLAELPVEKRRIFLLRYWYWEKIPEIASRVGKTENHVSVILSRLRAKLRMKLEKGGFCL